MGLDGIREKDEFHWLNIRTRECIDVVEIYYKRRNLEWQMGMDMVTVEVIYSQGDTERYYYLSS